MFIGLLVNAAVAVVIEPVLLGGCFCLIRLSDATALAHGSRLGPRFLWRRGIARGRRNACGKPSAVSV